MSVIRTRFSPIHGKAIVGYPFGIEDDSYSLGYHTGTDFPASGTDFQNPDLYSVVNGEVVYVFKDSAGTGTSPALGNQVMIKDNITGYFYRYCHLDSVNVSVGDKVTLKTKIGVMGNTGNSSGTHLHLELTPTMEWKDFMNPVEPLGIPNETGTIVYYDNTKKDNKNKKYKTPFIFIKRVDISL